jgi:hypothetical protein
MPNLFALQSVVFCVLLSAVAVADDPGEIQQAIVYDSAMSHLDFERIARSTSGVSPSDFKDKSLTFVIMSLDAVDTEAANRDFRVLWGDTPRPAAMAKEIYRERITGNRRILTGAVTLIHADRITSFACDIKGNVATGNVRFRVPGLYEGSAKFRALKSKSSWIISEFQIPSREIHLVRNQNGFWTSKPN